MFGTRVSRTVKDVEDVAIPNDPTSVVIDRGVAKTRNMHPDYARMKWGDMNTRNRGESQRKVARGLLLRNGGRQWWDLGRRYTILLPTGAQELRHPVAEPRQPVGRSRCSRSPPRPRSIIR